MPKQLIRDEQMRRNAQVGVNEAGFYLAEDVFNFLKNHDKFNQVPKLTGERVFIGRGVIYIHPTNDRKVALIS